MNKIAEQIAKILGSAPVILGFLAWLIFHNATAWDYTNFISDVAIEIGLLILRAEAVQSKRQEEISKEDLRATKRLEKHLT